MPSIPTVFVPPDIVIVINAVSPAFIGITACTLIPHPAPLVMMAPGFNIEEYVFEVVTMLSCANVKAAVNVSNRIDDIKL